MLTQLVIEITPDTIDWYRRTYKSAPSFEAGQFAITEERFANGRVIIWHPKPQTNIVIVDTVPMRTLRILPADHPIIGQMRDYYRDWQTTGDKARVWQP